MAALSKCPAAGRAGRLPARCVWGRLWRGEVACLWVRAWCLCGACEGVPGCGGSGRCPGGLGHFPLWRGERKGRAQTGAQWDTGRRELAHLTLNPGLQHGPPGLPTCCRFGVTAGASAMHGGLASISSLCNLRPDPCLTGSFFALDAFSLLTSCRGGRSRRGHPPAWWLWGLGTGHLYCARLVLYSLV